MNRSFCSNQMSNVSESLILLTKNERPWVIRSSHSEEISYVSELLISLTKNEWRSESLIFFEWIAHSLNFWQKQAIRSEIKWAHSQPFSSGGWSTKMFMKLSWHILLKEQCHNIILTIVLFFIGRAARFDLRTAVATGCCTMHNQWATTTISRFIKC